MLVPTKDSVRYKFLARMLVLNGKHVLFTGPTGTGKTVDITQLISSELPKKYIPMVLAFSAQTSANQTQDIIDGKLEKRQRGVYVSCEFIFSSCPHAVLPGTVQRLETSTFCLLTT